jgi:hypothetical protein
MFFFLSYSLTNSFLLTDRDCQRLSTLTTTTSTTRHGKGDGEDGTTTEGAGVRREEHEKGPKRRRWRLLGYRWVFLYFYIHSADRFFFCKWAAKWRMQHRTTRRKEKGGPRHVEVSWAVGKFFLSFYFNRTNCFVYLLCEMAHTAPYDKEKEKKTTQDTLTCLGPYVSFFFYLSTLIY